MGTIQFSSTKIKNSLVNSAKWHDRVLHTNMSFVPSVLLDSSLCSHQKNFGNFRESSEYLWQFSVVIRTSSVLFGNLGEIKREILHTSLLAGLEH